ncbi:hypothetical protein B566_EDAN011190 [Ephemera danica]|nr:hypothetical protein B566_EDAN011190 [Ephemera danica]
MASPGGGISAIAEFYRDRCILITGATGFMGKIRSIFLLMRPKRGQDVRTRLNELLNAQLFDGLRREHPEALGKLIPVAGDIMQPELGISPADQRTLMEHVSVVFHSAATVKFDEALKLSQSAGLPVAIVRPSIVTAAWKEPLPGWVDNLNGPTGMIAGAGKGVLRTLLCYRDFVADLVPVDVCINLMVSVAWHTATARPNDIIVYNCTSGCLNPIRWHDVEKLGYEFLLKNPCSDVLWYPAGSFKSSRLVNSFCVIAFHLAPALIPTIPSMMRIQEKLQRAVACLEFFTTHEWRFTNENVIRLADRLSPRDRRLFNFDIRELDWREYIEKYVLGVRKYI